MAGPRWGLADSAGVAGAGNSAGAAGAWDSAGAAGDPNCAETGTGTDGDNVPYWAEIGGAGGGAAGIGVGSGAIGGAAVAGAVGASGIEFAGAVGAPGIEAEGAGIGAAMNDGAGIVWGATGAGAASMVAGCLVWMTALRSRGSNASMVRNTSRT